MRKRFVVTRIAGAVSSALDCLTSSNARAPMMVAMALAALPSVTFAQDQDDDDPAKTLDAVQVISTGTRKSNMAVTDSPAPIQLVSAEKLKDSGASDLMNQLATQVPSYNASQIGTDMASQTLTATLRGLSANHALILVNGKRRHITSNVNVSNGAAPVDLSFIPDSAIDHVEVLTDGAAALYGSDAIAGVINIILKRDHDGGQVDAGYGGYGDGGGQRDKWDANIGFGNSDGFFNLSAEVENRKAVRRPTDSYYITDCAVNYTDCAATNSSLASTISGDLTGMSLANGYPVLNVISGTPEVHRKALMFNSGLNLGDTTEFYAFGSFGKKTAKSAENYRRPTQDGGYTDSTTGETTHMYAQGFTPYEASDEVDYDLTAGFKGMLGDWSWDASTSYGKDKMDVYTLHTMNFSLWQEYGWSPTDFYDGSYWSSQWTTNVNATRDFDIGLASPLTFNAGVEYRQDKYGIDAGDPDSYYGVGASSFPGYNPASNTGAYSRNSYAVFVDGVVNPIDKWLVDLAGRYEHYSDFGSKAVGKLTSRFDFSDGFAVRGTVSTGFRAPTLQEEYYSAVQVGPTSASPTIAANSYAASLLGFGKLKPETSTNYSLGFVFNPIPDLSSTLDFYRIEIKDRIMMGSLAYASGGEPADTDGDGTPDAEYNAAIGETLVALGYLGSTDPLADGGTLDSTARNNVSVYLFNNALDTRTTGVDWVTNYTSRFGWGTIDWNLAANYNKMEVTHVQDAPATLGGAVMYSALTVYNLENASPKWRVNLGGTANWDKFSFRLSESIYGPMVQAASIYNSYNGDIFPDEVLSGLNLINLGSGTYYQRKIGVMPITNVQFSYKPSEHWTLSVGSDNVFNRYPDKVPRVLWNYLQSNYLNTFTSEYWTFSPAGYFGAYYYAKATYRW